MAQQMRKDERESSGSDLKFFSLALLSTSCGTTFPHSSTVKGIIVIRRAVLATLFRV